MTSVSAGAFCREHDGNSAHTIDVTAMMTFALEPHAFIPNIIG
jgi:hypothetical protein